MDMASPIIASQKDCLSDDYDSTQDLIGEPFAVLESDPGVFTTLVRALGIPKVEVVELYDIEPWATDHLGSPIGLIFCFLYQKDKHRPREFRDSAGERLWFANQLCEDACASQALLNIVFNTDVEIGGTLAAFKADTMEMSPVMRGLAISNSLPIRAAHNALARPADIRGSINAIAVSTVEAEMHAKSPRTHRKATHTVAHDKTSPTTRQRQRSDIQSADDLEETYHFIGYIPAHGKVWELDGLKPGPLEVGEMNYGGSGAEGWMDVVRPALRLKMKKYGGAEEGANIKFNLLALVNEQYCNASDELELAKRKRSQLERRLDAKYPQGWQGQVRVEASEMATNAFATSANPSSEAGPTYAKDFGQRTLKMSIDVLHMSENRLVDAWQDCVSEAVPAKIAAEDELTKAYQTHTEQVKRTHDYEPFIHGFITCLHRDHLLNPLIGRDEDGKRLPATKTRR